MSQINTTITLIACLLISNIGYTVEFDEKDNIYINKIIPISQETNEQLFAFNKVVANFQVETDISISQTTKLCSEANPTYKQLRKLETALAVTEPGKTLINFHNLLNKLIVIRIKILIIVINLCAEDPDFEKPEALETVAAKLQVLNNQEQRLSTELAKEAEKLKL